MSGEAEGIKFFSNNSGKDLRVTMFKRAGSRPSDIGPTQMFSLPNGTQNLEVVYLAFPGSEGLAFLNGLLLEWQENGNWVGVSKQVITRGNAWDNTLNTNNHITIGDLAAGTMSVSGHN